MVPDILMHKSIGVACHRFRTIWRASRLGLDFQSVFEFHLVRGPIWKRAASRIISPTLCSRLNFSSIVEAGEDRHLATYHLKPLLGEEADRFGVGDALLSEHAGGQTTPACRPIALGPSAGR